MDLKENVLETVVLELKEAVLGVGSTHTVDRSSHNRESERDGDDEEADGDSDMNIFRSGHTHTRTHTLSLCLSHTNVHTYIHSLAHNLCFLNILSSIVRSLFTLRDSDDLNSLAYSNGINQSNIPGYGHNIPGYGHNNTGHDRHYGQDGW